MKNRNDGGYSLALVLVVMAVLAVIATTILTVTLNNMKSQEYQIQQMQDQYEAQGKLEKVLAELSQNQVVELQTEDSHAEAVKKVVSDLCGTEVLLTVADDAFTLWKDATMQDVTKATEFDTIFTYNFTLEAKSDSNEVSVTYDLQLKGTIAYSFSPQQTSINTTDNMHLYIITLPEITHNSVSVGGVE